MNSSENEVIRIKTGSAGKIVLTVMFGLLAGFIGFVHLKKPESGALGVIVLIFLLWLFIFFYIHTTSIEFDGIILVKKGPFFLKKEFEIGKIKDVTITEKRGKATVEVIRIHYQDEKYFDIAPASFKYSLV